MRSTDFRIIEYLELEYYGKGAIIMSILATMILEKYLFFYVLYTTLLNEVGSGKEANL